MRCSPIIGRSGAPDIVFDILTAGTQNIDVSAYSKADIQVIAPGGGGAYSSNVASTPAGGGAGGSHAWIIALDISGETSITAILGAPGVGRSSHNDGGSATATNITGAVLGNIITQAAGAPGGNLLGAVADASPFTVKSGAGTSRGSQLGGAGAEGIANVTWQVGGGGGAAGRNGPGGAGSGGNGSGGGAGGGQRGSSGSSNRPGGSGGGVALGPVGASGTGGVSASDPGQPGSGGAIGGDPWSAQVPNGGLRGGGGGAGGATVGTSGAGAAGAIRIRLYN